ncbi:TetR/AcrR family transcriptional regulator [Streptomyces sp. NPDC059524]|uniref:TetR/AcrR family transcriptional regulator n=1 Tax=Streptomyces sp. NPDC059524 TaxID=3346856 RepID=UPI00369E5FD5
MSPKQRRGAETAERLLDAALTVYSEAGEQGVTVSALTRTSGVSLGSLYHHFGSVDGLMNALVVRWLGRLLEHLGGALAEPRGARAGIESIVHAYLSFVRDHPDEARLLHSAYADRLGMEQARQLRDAQEARLSPLTRWLEGYVAAGEIADLPGPVLEALVLGPVIGFARGWLAGVSGVAPDEAARLLPDRIWRSLEP